jgi:hypothetical protein
LYAISPRTKTLGEKYEGLKEEVKGKVKRNPEQVQHGKDMISGELKRREREADVRPHPVPGFSMC